MIKYQQKNGVNYVSFFPRKYAGGQTRQITVLKGKSMMFDLQKANMTKRISAFIFDLIITMTLTVAFGAVISFISGYDKHYDACVSVITRYEKEYDLSYYIDENEFTSLSESDRLSYEKMCDAIAKDEDFIYHNHYYFNLSLLIISLGILLAVLVVDFIFPVFLKEQARKILNNENNDKIRGLIQQNGRKVIEDKLVNYLTVKRTENKLNQLEKMKKAIKLILI